jgi:hypothetical protein
VGRRVKAWQKAGFLSGIIFGKIKMTILDKLGVKESFELKSV